MTLDEFITNPNRFLTEEQLNNLTMEDIEVDVRDGRTVDFERVVDKARVRILDFEYDVEFDEPPKEENVKQAVIVKEGIESIISKASGDSVTLVEEGEHPMIEEDTKKFKCLLAVANLGPVTRNEVVERCTKLKLSSQVHTLKEDGFIAAVWDETQPYYYALTEAGWNEVFSRYDPEEYEDKAAQMCGIGGVNELFNTEESEEDSEENDTTDTQTTIDDTVGASENQDEE